MGGRAGRDVDDVDANLEGDSSLTLGDVLPDELAKDMVGTCRRKGWTSDWSKYTENLTLSDFGRHWAVRVVAAGRGALDQTEVTLVVAALELLLGKLSTTALLEIATMLEIVVPVACEMKASVSDEWREGKAAARRRPAFGGGMGVGDGGRSKPNKGSGLEEKHYWRVWGVRERKRRENGGSSRSRRSGMLSTVRRSSQRQRIH
jgi:hypothetical protein